MPNTGYATLDSAMTPRSMVTDELASETLPFVIDASPALRFRRSLAVRITALVVVLLFAAGVSAVVMMGQVRAMQSSFDRLTEVYVVFNQRLADANVQAVRVHEQIVSHQKRGEGFPAPDQAFLKFFALALDARNEKVQAARAPIDTALREPSRYGGAEQLEELQEIQRSLDELQDLTDNELALPDEVLEDIKTQDRITRLFKKLSDQSARAIIDLRDEVRTAQVKTERLTFALTLGTLVLGIFATVGVFLTLRPLRQLTQRVRDLGRGDWTQRVEIPGTRRGDEVSQLAAEFNTMAAALEERERRLLQGERLAAAGQLAAQITHEIRNPLSSVALNVELLEDELAEASPEGRHLLHEITKEVDRLTQITEDYLRFARRPKPELVPLDLAGLLRALLEFMRPTLEQAGIEHAIDLPEGPVVVRGDPNQLRQAFMNLVRNAEEAACDQDARTPWIAVRLQVRDRRVHVVVADDGPGIPLQGRALDRIFEAFYTRKARGTGLGLSIVQQILGDHGGTVRVAETGPTGTAFEVTIPAVETDTERSTGDAA